ncbi:MAG TPA: UDP-N-acetylmuramate--L-alanine ligase [Bacteroidales bacterium]|nr:UDP-N-acetylmuramate--L-alanine ligase [Bacteroidales bacterium]
MMWSNLDSVYFVGIGGIGMSALARFFKVREKHVAGYDRVSGALTDQLMREEIDIHFIDNVALIDDAFKDPERTLVIYTPAVPETHEELNYFRKHGFRVIKRSVALGEVFNASYGIAVAGTHGKTSVSTMLAHIMADSGHGCNAFLGGIAKNFDSNLVVHPTSELVIAEADEYDRSFLALYPQMAVVTSMDDDHLDIYGSREKLIKGFESFIAQVADKGKVIIKKEVPLDVPANLRVFTYSMEDPDADYSLQALSLQERAYLMTVKTPKNIFEATLGIPGKVNVENALAAIAVADQLGVPLEGISKACTTFRGVKRRFDVQVNRDDRIYIDDYAHHPEEIRAFIESVRSIYPDKRITGIFQPHLYSRTRDFATGFAESLSLLDELVLLDIYPAREEPIAGVTSEMIFQNVDLREKVLISNDLLMKVMEERDPELLLTMGAGDIDRLVEPLKSWMEQR